MAYLPDVSSDGQTPGGLKITGGIKTGSSAVAGIVALDGATTFNESASMLSDGLDVVDIYQQSPLTENDIGDALYINRSGVVGAFAYNNPTVWIQDNNPGSADTVKIERTAGTGYALEVQAPSNLYGLALALQTVVADYPMRNIDSTIVVNAASKTITLPSAVTAKVGRIYVVVNGPSGATTTVASAAGTINGASTDTTLTTAYDRATFQSDGTDWLRIG